jgi:chorismate dehydratase
LLADQLQAGHLDVAIIPSIEYIRPNFSSNLFFGKEKSPLSPLSKGGRGVVGVRGLYQKKQRGSLIKRKEKFQDENYQIIPNISISSHGPVRSVKLFSKVPVEKLRRVALDTSSRTSRALLKILLAEKYRLNPEYTSYDHRSPIHNSDADAVLLIGDMAMQQSDEGWYTLDLGEEWHSMTGTPFVYALWVTHPRPLPRGGITKENAVLDDIPQILQKAKQEGLKLIPEIAQIEALKLNLPESLCREYLTQNIGYDLNEAELAGLRLFYNYAVKLGLTRSEIEIAFAKTRVS